MPKEQIFQQRKRKLFINELKFVCEFWLRLILFGIGFICNRKTELRKIVYDVVETHGESRHKSFWYGIYLIRIYPFDYAYTHTRSRAFILNPSTRLDRPVCACVHNIYTMRRVSVRCFHYQYFIKVLQIRFNFELNVVWKLFFTRHRKIPSTLFCDESNALCVRMHVCLRVCGYSYISETYFL